MSGKVTGSQYLRQQSRNQSTKIRINNSVNHITNMKIYWGDIWIWFLHNDNTWIYRKKYKQGDDDIYYKFKG